MTEYRIEHDSMGDVRVPVEAKWGAQTRRAVENFPISGVPIERMLIRALALIKGAQAFVQRAREAGFEEHLAKPSSLEKLEELLARSPAGSLPLPRPHN